MNWWRKWIGGGRLSSRTTLKQRKLRAKDSREDLVDYLLESAAIAENEGDADTMRSLSYKFIRLELYERAWELRVRSADLAGFLRRVLQLAARATMLQYETLRVDRIPERFAQFIGYRDNLGHRLLRGLFASCVGEPGV